MYARFEGAFFKLGLKDQTNTKPIMAEMVPQFWHTRRFSVEYKYDILFESSA